MKAARELVKTGRVSDATYEPPLLAGEVRDGSRRYRAGLRIRSASDVENICTCRESREWGKVCPHSLAVGLAWLAPPSPAPVVSTSENAGTPPSPYVSLGEVGARPLALHFILPPNFRAAWEKRQVMICIEAEMAGRRLMLDALPKDERFGCDDSDLIALNSLGREAAAVNLLAGPAFLQWLAVVRGHPRLSFGRSGPARVLGEVYRPHILLQRAGEVFELSARLGANEVPLVVGPDAWLWRGGDFLSIGDNLPPRLTSALGGPLRLRPETADEFLALEAPLWREVADLELPAGIERPVVEEAQPAFSLQLEGSLQHLRAILRCAYGDRPAFFPLSDPDKRFVFRDPANLDRLLVRNLAVEKEALTRLEDAGFARADDTLELRDSARIVRFFAFDYPALPRSWNLSVTPRLEKASRDLEPVKPEIEIVRSGEDWFELKYSVATAAGEGIPLAEVQRLLRGGQSQARLTNGKTAVFDPAALDDFEQVLRDADPRQSQPGVYRLKKIQAAYLAHTAEEIGARLIGASQFLQAKPPISSLGTLADQLRDYQRSGVQWMAALAVQNLGGILADEMGLGKTVQTLALLRLDRDHGPALIVCPTSLLSNWEREAARFTPELKVLRIDAANRAEKIACLPEHDLALTSYGLLRRDVELYTGLSLRTVVLDEAQHIKNPDTQNAQAAFSLNASSAFHSDRHANGKLGPGSLVADEFRRARLSRQPNRLSRALRASTRDQPRAGAAASPRPPSPPVPPPPSQSRGRARAAGED